jgi:dTDP-4-amino-4,6-dideoxygalactose transaminase
MEKIKMVNLESQYLHIKKEIDDSVLKCIKDGNYINGPEVTSLEENLKIYLNVKHVIACANGTDALQIALMSLGLNVGDEIICPAFTYIATAEVIALLGLVPILVEVDSRTFNIQVEAIEKAITSRTRVIIPVHLYGQASNMDEILFLAKKYSLFVIEDNAQSFGAEVKLINGVTLKAGTIGDIGTTSFFPSKILGCFGDGGAIFTNNNNLANKIRMIANHGQERKYFHKVLGCNSRLDSIQASILNIKLKYIDNYINARQSMANFYDKGLSSIEDINIPYRNKNNTHVFHQYTIKIKNNKRNDLKKYLEKSLIPCMIYYPLPVYKQEAFSKYFKNLKPIKIVEDLCSEVISLPIHTEQNIFEQEYICNKINDFFKI